VPSDRLYGFFRDVRVFEQGCDAVMSESVHSKSRQFRSGGHFQPSAFKACLMTRGIVQRTMNAEGE